MGLLTTPFVGRGAYWQFSLRRKFALTYKGDYIPRDEHFEAEFPYTEQARYPFFDRGNVIGLSKFVSMTSITNAFVPATI